MSLDSTNGDEEFLRKIAELPHGESATQDGALASDSLSEWTDEMEEEHSQTTDQEQGALPTESLADQKPAAVPKKILVTAQAPPMPRNPTSDEDEQDQKQAATPNFVTQEEDRRRPLYSDNGSPPKVKRRMLPQRAAIVGAFKGGNREAYPVVALAWQDYSKSMLPIAKMNPSRKVINEFFEGFLKYLGENYTPGQLGINVSSIRDLLFVVESDPDKEACYDDASEKFTLPLEKKGKPVTYEYRVANAFGILHDISRRGKGFDKEAKKTKKSMDAVRELLGWAPSQAIGTPATVEAVRSKNAAALQPTPSSRGYDAAARQPSTALTGGEESPTGGMATGSETVFSHKHDPGGARSVDPKGKLNDLLKRMHEWAGTDQIRNSLLLQLRESVKSQLKPQPKPDYSQDLEAIKLETAIEAAEWQFRKLKEAYYNRLKGDKGGPPSGKGDGDDPPPGSGSAGYQRDPPPDVGNRDDAQSGNSGEEGQIGPTGGGEGQGSRGSEVEEESEHHVERIVAVGAISRDDGCGWDDGGYSEVPTQLGLAAVQETFRIARTSLVAESEDGKVSNALLSQGARLTHQQLLQFPPRDPPDEDLQYDLHRAYSGNMQHLKVVPADPTSEPPPPIWLVRDQHLDSGNPSHAYALVPGTGCAVGEHRHRDWGRLFRAFVCPRMGRGVYQAPHPQDAQHVMIKRLSKRHVHEYMDRGGVENPYKDVSRMQEFGDNAHVLECIDFLEDDTYLYIITPHGHLGTLRDAINWNDSDKIMDPHRCHQLFCQILEILAYLEHHGIHHHDLSPDNFLFLTPDNLVLFDFGISLRMPVDPETGQRTLIQAGVGSFGTVPWMSPEHFSNRSYDGVAMDLFSAGHILYNLLTNQLLFEQPYGTDGSYKFFVLQRRLSSDPLNAGTLQFPSAIACRRGHDKLQVCRRLQVIISNMRAQTTMGPQALNLLENLIREDPAERFTLAQAVESAFVSLQGDPVPSCKPLRTDSSMGRSVPIDRQKDSEACSELSTAPTYLTVTQGATSETEILSEKLLKIPSETDILSDDSFKALAGKLLKISECIAEYNKIRLGKVGIAAKLSGLEGLHLSATKCAIRVGIDIANRMISKGPGDSEVGVCDIFLSHAGTEKFSYVPLLKEKLEEKDPDRKIFHDSDDLEIGENKIGENLFRRILTARLVVHVVSYDFVQNKWPIAELLCGLARSANALPVFVDAMPGEKWLASDLGKRRKPERWVNDLLCLFPTIGVPTLTPMKQNTLLEHVRENVTMRWPITACLATGPPVQMTGGRKRRSES